MMNWVGWNHTKKHRTGETDMELTAEQAILENLDRAWNNRLRIERQFADDRWSSWEDKYNAYGYLETAQRTIDANWRDLDRLRAEDAVTERHVATLASAAGTTGDPVLTVIAYTVYGPAVLAALNPTVEVRLLDPEHYTVPRAVELTTDDYAPATQARLLAVNAKADADNWGVTTQGYTTQVTPLRPPPPA